MKILIFGVNSFIGKNFVKMLSDKGHEITGTYRHENENTHFLKNNYKNLNLVKIDLTKPEDFREIQNHFDVVLIAAAVSKTSQTTDEEIRNCNVCGIKNISDFCRDKGINRIIYLSTMSIYGNVSSEIIDENTLPESPDYYGESKFEGEKILSSLNVDTILLRIPGVLGEGASRSWFPVQCDKLLKNEDIEIFNPEKLFNATLSVTDLSHFVAINCVAKPWKGIHAFPLATKNPVSIGEIVMKAKVNLKSESVIKTVDSDRISFLIDTNYAEKNFSYIPRDTTDVINEYLASLKNLP